MEPGWLPEQDARLLRAIGEAVERSERCAGKRLEYSRGCPACCLGPFPINRLDALRLRRGLEEVAVRDPTRAERIRARATEAVGRMAPDFPGQPETGELADDEAARDTFFKRFGGLPCPALDLRSGTCQLYAFRPFTCRTFGPPVRIGEQDLEACAICFHGSAAEEEACRVEPDPDRLEDALLDRLEEAEGPRGETVIAYALARPLL